MAAKKGDVFRFADQDYLIQKVEEKVVRVTKFVNGKPQRGRPTKMDRTLVEGLVGEPLETTTEAEVLPTTVVESPVPELSPEEKKQKRNKLASFISSLGEVSERESFEKTGNAADDLLLDEEEVLEEQEELSSLFGE